MKLSAQWLREWIDTGLKQADLSSRLTMAGLEVESISPVAEPFSKVVVAEVLSVEKHPEADRLKVCQVNVGEKEPLTIVCGASNVRPQLKVAAALIGAELPNNLKITRSKIRNVYSNGMLCSWRELGVSDESAGILELAPDAPVGEDLRDYLNLADEVLDVSITPNRGDCLSIKGIARELSAITGVKYHHPDIQVIKPVGQDALPIKIDFIEGCPRYVGRIIKNVKADARTPVWMQQRLQRGGIRSISAIVDVMNYVMLELGQPMHAFDLQKINGEIHVRKANSKERLLLLDGQTVDLSPETMVIADDHAPLAIAGVMGGAESGVTLLTENIFLESAYFDPKTIAHAARLYQLDSDSCYRFERGIDPLIQVEAIERATQLILEIAGGAPGPVTAVQQDKFLPKPITLALSREKVQKLLGLVITDQAIENILDKLAFSFKQSKSGWDVSVPAYRSDITIPVDLIEEIIRLYGYDRLPVSMANVSLAIEGATENSLSIQKLRQICCDLGYHEAITYSFIDKNIQQQFDPDHPPKALVNPITVDMAVMRTTLWPGLVQAYLYNKHRQQPRIRLFETGLRFINQSQGLSQQRMLSGLVSGGAFPEQWGVMNRATDFFDLKGDIEKLFRLASIDNFEFKIGSHPALHPGQTAEIYRDGEVIGICGLLHPGLKQSLELPENVFLFELRVDGLVKITKSKYEDISKFPEIRRDIAIFVDQTVPAQAIQDTIVEVGGEWLKDVRLFDVYQGKGVEATQKSLALSITLQHASRTLVDEEVTGIIDNVIAVLKERFAAELRG